MRSAVALAFILAACGPGTGEGRDVAPIDAQVDVLSPAEMELVGTWRRDVRPDGVHRYVIDLEFRADRTGTAREVVTRTCGPVRREVTAERRWYIDEAGVLVASGVRATNSTTTGSAAGCSITASTETSEYTNGRFIARVTGDTLLYSRDDFTPQAYQRVR